MVIIQVQKISSLFLVTYKIIDPPSLRHDFARGQLYLFCSI